MEIVILEKNRLSEIKPLWEQLNKLHERKSNHHKHRFTQNTFEARIKPIFGKDSFAVFIAEHDEEIVGYIIVSVEKNVGEIDSIFVIPQHRKNGLGKQLMEKAESWLTGQDVSKIVISVAEGNEVVFPFYQKLGYSPDSTILGKNNSDT